MSEYRKDLMELAYLNKSYQDLMKTARVRAKFLVEYCTKLEEYSIKYGISREDLMNAYSQVG